MLENQNYELIFTDFPDTIPKSIKGDYISLNEIKILPSKIYHPKLFNKQRFPLVTKSTNTNDENNNQVAPNQEKETDKINIDNKKEEEIHYKYVISTVPNNLVYLGNFPNGIYYTNDKDLKQLIDLFNEPTTKEFGYTNVIDEKKCKVYKRMVEGSPVILIKCIAQLPYSKDIVFESIANLEIRKQWDSVFSELRVVNHEGEDGAEILFMVVKSPVFFISNREFVQQRKMWKNFPTEKSHTLHFISVENHECPRSKKNVRAETIISGYYMQDDPNNPEHCLLGVLSHTDLKGSLPYILVNKVAPSSSKGWVKSLHKGCELTLKMQQNNINNDK